MTAELEPTEAFFEKHKAALETQPTAEAPKDAEGEPTEPAVNADKPAESEPSGESTAAPATAKAPDLSQFDVETRERLKALPLEVQQAAEALSKRQLADYTRKMQALSKDRNKVEAFDRLVADPKEQAEFFRWRQERAGGAKEPEAPKSAKPKPWFNATNDEEFDRVARETVREEMAPVMEQIKALHDRLIAPAEKTSQATEAWNAAVEAEGIEVGTPEYDALTKHINQSLMERQLKPAEVVNASNAQAFVMLARQAIQAQPSPKPSPQPIGAKAATIRSSGSGRPVKAPTPWEAQGRAPTDAEFFTEFAKTHYGLTERDLGDLLRSGQTRILSTPG